LRCWRTAQRLTADTDGDNLQSGNSYDWNANFIPDECDGLGDLDSNGVVDASDLPGFCDCLRGPATAISPVDCPADSAFRADIDGDSDIDLADFARFCRLAENGAVGVK
jgi:hypothetical protein